MLTVRPEAQSSAASIALRSHRLVPGIGPGTMPCRIQSLNEARLQPQYAAACALDRTRGIRLTLHSAVDCLLVLSARVAWRCPAIGRGNRLRKGGLRFSNDRCRSRIVVKASAKSSLAESTFDLGTESMKILQKNHSVTSRRREETAVLAHSLDSSGYSGQAKNFDGIASALLTSCALTPAVSLPRQRALATRPGSHPSNQQKRVPCSPLRFTTLLGKVTPERIVEPSALIPLRGSIVHSDRLGDYVEAR